LKKIFIPLLILAAAGAVWYFKQAGDLPAVSFAKPIRQTISNTLSTNGKVEPIEFVDVRVEIRGLVKSLPVRVGDTVTKGEVLAELSQPGVAEELSAAQARVAQARAELEGLRSGGRGAELSEIEGNINRLRAQKEAAQKNAESLDRLVKASAATRFEADQAEQLVRDLDTQIQSLSQRKSALVGKSDLAASEARLREAEVNVQLARTHGAQNFVRAPMAGVLYSLPARLGAYLQAGDPVGSVGKLDPLQVRVYVDEPELGRVAPGEAVRITWDALPGKEWTGTVQKRPSEVIALGSRQVGEVLCTIANPDRQLVPGTNVNAFILTQVVPNALTIPKTAVRRDSGVGVYALDRAGNTVRWQPVKTGASDALRVEIVSGLSDSDLVAQPSDTPLKDGMKVQPK
jgi:HlyD family secretion protein